MRQKVSDCLCMSLPHVYGVGRVVTSLGLFYLLPKHDRGGC
jgi:hypothetical protein